MKLNQIMEVRIELRGTPGMPAYYKARANMCEKIIFDSNICSKAMIRALFDELLDYLRPEPELESELLGK